MTYKGSYWALFAPLIKKSVARRYSAELAEKAIRNGKAEYCRLLRNADELGPGSPMAMNAYFAYVFVGAWLGSGRQIPPEGIGQVMTDVLYKMKSFFGMTNLNSKSCEKKWLRDMQKYAHWYEAHKDKYPVNWMVKFDESRHKDGSFYFFTRCPICEFCRREGVMEIMPQLCATDEIMFKLQHGVLHRAHTLAAGDGECDYWAVGDRVQNPR